jgi:GNAT superfamily N-acetyltransferase
VTGQFATSFGDRRLTIPDLSSAHTRIDIVRLTTLGGWRQRAAGLDPIFFDASLTRDFSGDEAKAAFRERWLGRFLDRWPELTHVAVDERGLFTGYIVGAHVDPAIDPAFADVGFYAHLTHLTPDFPAHFHINLAPDARGNGIGGRLIEAFVADAEAAGLSGIHLVTGRDSRNRSFYARNGFACVAELEWGGTPIVMLGRRVSGAGKRNRRP